MFYIKVKRKYQQRNQDINQKLILTLSVLEKVKNLIYDIPIIPQTLNINN